MSAHQDIVFKTLDGITLTGWLYPASKRGPAIILTPGVCKVPALIPLTSNLVLRSVLGLTSYILLVQLRQGNVYTRSR